MTKNSKMSHEMYLSLSWDMFIRIVRTAVIVVTIAAFIRGSDFEIFNIVKSWFFIILSCAAISYGSMYWAVKKSISLGEYEDNGIIFKRK